MPNIPGSTWDKKLKRYVPPEGYVRPATALKNARINKKKSHKARDDNRRELDPGPKEREEHVSRLRRQERLDQSFAVFALYPGQQRAWVGSIEDPSHPAVGAKFGGGKFQLVATNRNTGYYEGEPFDVAIDTSVYPARLPGFASGMPGNGALPPLQAPGFSGMPWGQPFPGMPGMPPQLQKGAKDEELEDLEDELDALKVQLAQAVRERDEAKAALVQESQRAMRMEFESKFMTGLASLEAKLSGDRKDPLQQFIDLKRVDAELNPAIGKQGGPGETMALFVGLFDMLMKAKDKFGDAGAFAGGAAGGFGEVLKTLAPLVEKVLDANATKPKPVVPLIGPAAPAAEGAVAQEEVKTPEPEAPPPVSAALKEASQQFFNYLESAQGAGIHPTAAAQWVLKQADPGWDELHKVLRDEDPKEFIGVAKTRIPDAVGTQQQQGWMMATVKEVREQLQKAV
jgi:hypothetical protein